MIIRCKCLGEMENATIIFRDAVYDTRALIYVSRKKFLYIAERYGDEWQTVSPAIEVGDEQVMEFYMRTGRA